MAVVACECEKVRARRYMGEDVCECGHIPHHHDYNGRCLGRRWDNDGYEKPTGLYSGKVERMPDFIEP